MTERPNLLWCPLPARNCIVEFPCWKSNILTYALELLTYQFQCISRNPVEFHYSSWTYNPFLRVKYCLSKLYVLSVVCFSCVLCKIIMCPLVQAISWPRLRVVHYVCVLLSLFQLKIFFYNYDKLEKGFGLFKKKSWKNTYAKVPEWSFPFCDRFR